MKSNFPLWVGWVTQYLISINMKESGDISRDDCYSCMSYHVKVFLCGAGISVDLWQFWFHWSPNDFNFPGSADEFDEENLFKLFSFPTYVWDEWGTGHIQFLRAPYRNMCRCIPPHKVLYCMAIMYTQAMSPADFRKNGPGWEISGQ